MYLLRVKIENIKSIKHLVWEIPEGEEAGWHVVIGDNGAGKTTFLRAVVFTLAGSVATNRLLPPSIPDWLRKDEQKAKVSLSVKLDFQVDEVATENPIETFTWDFTHGSEGKSHPLIDEKKGWFSASFGPFRRFTGGDEEFKKYFNGYPRAVSHLSLFFERIALNDCLEWLKTLHHAKLENPSEEKLLDFIVNFVNQEGFLPHHVRLWEVSSKGVKFVDANDCVLPVEELSDGFRSILSLTLELIRQLTKFYEFDQIFDKNDPSKIIAPGVVLIDEIDAHLHPTWQQQIGLWLKKLFPKMQFIVTTHSPLICQAADTVFLLPKPGTDEQGRMIEGIELNRLIYGNVLEAYGTQVFGKGVTRSEESKHLLRQLAELNLKEIHEGLTDEEMERQEELRAMFPTTPHTTG